MKSFRTYIWVGLLTLFLSLWGCGGQTIETAQFRPLGEGSIPIGRALNTCGCESNVRIVMSDGRIYNSVTRQQTVYAPVLPKGLTSVTLSPLAGLDPMTFLYVVGQDQFWAFNAWPSARYTPQSLKGIETNFINGMSFRVGDTFPLEAKILGANIGALQPTVIASGGVARIDSDQTMTFTKPGTGKLFLKAGLIQLSYTFTVRN